MGRRILNNALRAIVNAERRGKATVELQPISTVMSSFLNIMKYRENECKYKTWIQVLLRMLFSLFKLCLCLHYCLITWKSTFHTHFNGYTWYATRYLSENTSSDIYICWWIRKDFQVYDPHRVGKIKVELLGRVNDCRALTYRQDIKASEIEGYTVRALPTRQWGYVVITTPDGVLDHEEALRRNVGGQVLGYFH
ncbi:hypothetical protein CICLE_v10010805mg [Citrus x clementina]|uniref:30S ribosomal protein S8, chloroplastic n=1 Tax=Citrus clementina TaxID=85681 RepID=V4TVR1_CITCL|nr:hypothetical protein CICLE_v10010805mg [Citrus x clementina]